MKKLISVVAFFVLYALVFAGAMTVLVQAFPAQAKNVQGQPIYGLWFYQPPTDDVTIVSYNHMHTDVTDEQFGLSYTDTATQRCSQLLGGIQLQYLVRYRQDPILGWTVYCYTNQTNYVVFSGVVFGQQAIDDAVARAKIIVYGCAVSTAT